MALLFVRHGSSSLNAGDPSDPRDMFRGWTSVPLSDFGRQTVRQTAAWFIGKPIHMLISSDMPRAAETAQMVGETIGIQPTLDQRLRPWHIGVLTGQVITPELKDYINKLQTTDQNTPVPDGEAYNDFVQRYSSILPDLLRAGQQQNVVVVAHHRNALALSHMLYNKEPATEGPPDPGGIAAVTNEGLRPLFTPPAVAVGQYKEKASS